MECISSEVIDLIIEQLYRNRDAIKNPPNNDLIDSLIKQIEIASTEHIKNIIIPQLGEKGTGNENALDVLEMLRYRDKNDEIRHVASEIYHCVYHTSPRRICLQAIRILGGIATNNSKAINTLNDLLICWEDEVAREYILESLAKIDSSNFRWIAEYAEYQMSRKRKSVVVFRKGWIK